MSTGLKIFLFAVGAVILILFVALGVNTSSSGKSIAEIGTNQIKNAAKDKMDLLKAKYDGNAVIGSELVSLIEDTIENEEDLSIVVCTLNKSRTDYNYTYNTETKVISKTNATTTIADSKSDTSYINRTSLYACEAKLGTNGTVICLWFEQEK